MGGGVQQRWAHDRIELRRFLLQLAVAFRLICQIEIAGADFAQRVVKCAALSAQLAHFVHKMLAPFFDFIRRACDYRQ